MKNPPFQLARKLTIMRSSLSHFEALGLLAKEVIGENELRNEAQRASVCLSVAGGGAHAISALTATAGYVF